MRIVKQSFLEIEHESLYQKIELCGRVCYKSEDYITEKSGVDFTKRIMSYNHGSVLEHFVFVFRIDDEALYQRIVTAQFPFFTCTNISFPIVSFNFRAFYAQYLNDAANPILLPFYAYVRAIYPELLDKPFEGVDFSCLTFLKKDDMLDLTESEKDKHLVLTIKLTVDRGVSHELVRHRLASFAQESTRYCNYGKDKFGKEITVIEPTAITEKEYAIWQKAMEVVESCYFEILASSSSPQLARSVLPNSLKTELCITCNLQEWKLIFDLRCAPQAHPDVQEIMNQVKAYFLMKGYLC